MGGQDRFLKEEGLSRREYPEKPKTTAITVNPKKSTTIQHHICARCHTRPLHILPRERLTITSSEWYYHIHSLDEETKVQKG